MGELALPAVGILTSGLAVLDARADVLTTARPLLDARSQSTSSGVRRSPPASLIAAILVPSSPPSVSPPRPPERQEETQKGIRTAYKWMAESLTLGIVPELRGLGIPS